MKIVMMFFAAIILTTTSPAGEKPASTAPLYQMKNPEVVSLSKPAYPPFAFEHHIEGTVVVQVHLDSAAHPVAATVVGTSWAPFNDAAIEAALHARYSPAYALHGPVKSVMVIPFEFKIQ